jgi:1,4-dihydroxy-2-naphthoyl-CoA hydrolase
MLTTRHLPDGAGTSTVSSATNFLRPAPEGIYDVTVELVHAGRRTVVVTTDIINPAGRVVSRTTQTQAVLS